MKNIIKSKTINHCGNEFIYERSNTSRSISYKEYSSPKNIPPRPRLEYSYGTNNSSITSLKGMGC